MLAGRTRAQVTAYFDDLELLPPGLIPVTKWPAGPAAANASAAAPNEPLLMAEVVAGIGRKPA